MDIDNCVKPILDACQDAGIFADDVQVQALTIVRGAMKKHGGCNVIISEILASSDAFPKG